MTRERLPDERTGKTHHFTILSAVTPLDGAEGTTELEEIDGYIITGTYPDGRLGEIFIRIAKMGEEVSGTMDGFACVFSIALQSGADLGQLCSKLIGMRFVPNGPTNNPHIPRCTSLYDYIGRWLASAFLPLVHPVRMQAEGRTPPEEVVQ
jgi:ribonucleoside-diphosphate reductase alpha chain